MSDLTDPREPHPEPATPEDAPAQIPPEVVDAVTHGEPEPVASPTHVRDSAVDRSPSRQPQARGRSGTRVLIALGFLLLFGAVGYEYVRGEQLNDRLDGLEQAQGTNKSESDALLRSLQSEVEARTALRHDVDALQGVKPSSTTSTGTAANFGPLEARLKDLEQKVASLSAAPKADAAGSTPATSTPATTATDTTPPAITAPATTPPATAATTTATPTTSPATSAPDLGAIESRLKALEDKPAPAPAPSAPAPDVALLARVNSIADQLDGVGKKLAEAQTQAEAAQTSAQAAQARATVALTRAAATVALDNGKPLGTIPHAPPALTRFATEAPPTEASLRLSYDAAAQKAQDASVPPTAGKKFGARMLTRIESLVTVSQGDHVLVGPPAATILASAHEKLQAGDLAGAVATLAGLDPAAKAAMASWTDRAQSLLDARAALQSDQLGAP